MGRVDLPYGLTELKLKNRPHKYNTSLWMRYRPWNANEFHGPSAAVMKKISQMLFQGKSKNSADELLHSFLLSGEPGTGKTSIAVTLGKILNCYDPVEENGMVLACDECSSCKSIERMSMRGGHPALIYKDTSKLKVDEVRKLIEEVFHSGANMGARNTVLLLEEAQELTEKSLKNLLVETETMHSTHFMFLVSSEPDSIKKHKALMSRMREFVIPGWTTDQIEGMLKDIAANEELSGRPHVPVEFLNKIANNCEMNPRLAVNFLQTEVYQGGNDGVDGTFDISKLKINVRADVAEYAKVIAFGKLLMNGNVSGCTNFLYDNIVRKVNVGNFAYSVGSFMRENFGRFAKAGNLGDEPMLELIRGITAFNRTFYDYRNINPNDAIVLATMEAVKHTHAFRLMTKNK